MKHFIDFFLPIKSAKYDYSCLKRMNAVRGTRTIVEKTEPEIPENEITPLPPSVDTKERETESSLAWKTKR